MFDRAVSGLAELGCSLRQVSLPDSRPFSEGWAVTCGAETALVYEGAYEASPADMGPALRSLVEAGRTAPASAYAQLHTARLVLAARIDALFETVDLIATPVMPMPTPCAADLAGAAGSPEAVAALLRFTTIWNYSGHPCLTLPGGLDRKERPIGFQLVAPRLGERRLLAAGAAFQRITAWHKQRPTTRELRATQSRTLPVATGRAG